jgi:hypothetical protein
VRGGPGQRRCLAAGRTTDVNVVLHRMAAWACVVLLVLTTTGPLIGRSARRVPLPP